MTTTATVACCANLGFALSMVACSFDSSGLVGVYAVADRRSRAEPAPEASALATQDALAPPVPPTSAAPLPSLPPDGVIAVPDADADADAEAGPLPPVTAPRDWIAIGGDLQQSFARTEAPVEQATLESMRVRWTRAASGPSTGTPVVYDGVVYVGDWNTGVHAVTSEGTELWSAELESGVASTPFVTHDSVYVSSREPFVVALDRTTGAQRWRTRISDKALARLWGSPMVADGVVVVGLGAVRPANQDGTFSQADLREFRGAVIGLEADSGRVRWRFETTLGEDGKRYGPGAASRSTAAIDSARHIAYIGTSNSLEGPASPYSDSLLALDYTTSDPAGHLVWAYQFTGDDNFTADNPDGPDADVAATPNLFTMDGRDYVAVGDKGGKFYVLERSRGEFAWQLPVSAGSSTGGVVAGAAYADGTFYVSSNHQGSMRLLALRARDGAMLWSRDIPSSVSYASPLLLKDIVLLTAGATSSSDPALSRLVAYQRHDGADSGWSLPLPSRQAGGVSLFGSSIFVTYGFVLDNDRSRADLEAGLMVIRPD